MTVTIKSVEVNGKIRDILVREDGGEKVVYIECGNAAQIINLDRATESQLSVCYGADGIDWNVDNLHTALASAAGLRPEAIEPAVSRKRRMVSVKAANKNNLLTRASKAEGDEEDKNLITKVSEESPYAATFRDVVDFIMGLSATDFIAEVDFAKSHANRFSAKYAELQAAVNADDVYCSAVIRATRKYSPELERKTISAVLDVTRPAAERVAIWDFIKA